MSQSAQNPETATPDATTKTPCSSSQVSGSSTQAPGSSAQASGGHPVESNLGRSFLKGLVALVVWFAVYRQLPALSRWFTYSLVGLQPASHLGASVEFFLYDVPKIFLLLTLIVFFVGIIRSFFTPERTRAFLVGKSELAGNILAALLGIVTPFCTCSAVPLFIGFVTAGVPLGVTFSFLISSPMINEIALSLLFGLFGWKIAALYVGTGLLIAITAGWIIGRLSLEKHVEDWVYQVRMGDGEQAPEEPDPHDAGSGHLPPRMATSDVSLADCKRPTWAERITFAQDAVKEIIGKVWVFIILGIAVGAGIHGYAPAEALAGIMGRSWWCVPLAVLIGVPMYSNAAGIIPIVQALLSKGAALGTTLAFMMAVIGLSLPETIILRKVLKPTLIAIFIGVVSSGIILVGYLFNAVL